MMERRILDEAVRAYAGAMTAVSALSMIMIFSDRALGCWYWACP